MYKRDFNVYTDDYSLWMGDGSASFVRNSDFPKEEHEVLPATVIKKSGGIMRPTADDKIGMVVCLNQHCITNKPAKELRKFGLLKKVRGRDFAIDPVPEWDKVGKNGKKIANGFYILKKHVEKTAGKYNKDMHTKLEKKLIRPFLQYIGMVRLRQEFGHICNTLEVHSNDWFDAPYTETDDSLHDNSTRLVCPYCHSDDIILNTGRKKDDTFDSDDKEHVAELEKKLHTRNLSNIPNPDCTPTQEVYDRYWEFVRDSNAYRRLILDELDELEWYEDRMSTDEYFSLLEQGFPQPTRSSHISGFYNDLGAHQPVMTEPTIVCIVNKLKSLDACLPALPDYSNKS